MAPGTAGGGEKCRALCRKKKREGRVKVTSTRGGGVGSICVPKLRRTTFAGDFTEDSSYGQSRGHCPARPQCMQETNCARGAPSQKHYTRGDS